MDRKFTIVTGHGRLEFIKKADGRLELTNVNGRTLSKKDMEIQKKDEREEMR